MQVTVALDARYGVAPDGSVWSQCGMARQFWERYLEVFDKVTVVARAVRLERVPEGWLSVNSREVVFHGLPDYCGPWQYVRRCHAIWGAVRAAVPVRGAVILRVGAQIPNILESYLHKREHPYALEVIGDPYEVFAPGVVDHPLRRVFRWALSGQLRRQCCRACGVAYVTRWALQKRYPARLRSFSVSDVELPDDAFLGPGPARLALRANSEACGPVESVVKGKRGHSYKIVTVGSLSQLYKGTDVLIEAVARCVQEGMDLTVAIVGDGRYRHALMAQADRAGVAARIRFHGQVAAGEPVRRILDTADLFVLPSRTEGLPRALLEAMARGLPCVASAVGGTAELLEASDLVPAGDPDLLALKIRQVLSDAPRMERMACRSFAAAREFHDSVLSRRRREFYGYVRDYTHDWEAHRADPPGIQVGA